MEYVTTLELYFGVQILKVEQSQRAIIENAESNSLKTRRNNPEHPVSYSDHKFEEKLTRVAWTPDMGVNYTSFSPVTQGWNSDPSSVVDSQGRQIFSITTPPENWTILPPYGPLMHRGCVLLDHKSQPVRDIPGLPLTLSTSVEGWFLGGLRRCIQLEMRE